VINGPLDTLKRARKLRSEMSLPEAVLWRELRKRPGEFKFRRQHPAGVYVLDFYCARVSLAIEIDGIAHDNAVAARRDERRSQFLKSQHVATLRIPAKVVLEEIEVAVTRIVEVCRQRAERLSRLRPVPLHHPADGPPPRAGEDS
jgi:very-short-patch-repair endonuclease